MRPGVIRGQVYLNSCCLDVMISVTNGFWMATTNRYWFYICNIVFASLYCILPLLTGILTKVNSLFQGSYQLLFQFVQSIFLLLLPDFVVFNETQPTVRESNSSRVSFKSTVVVHWLETRLSPRIVNPGFCVYHNMYASW